jgi:hypothetical protein
MDQFAQLRDRAKDFEKRSTQVFIVFPYEPALIRQWLRGRNQWPTLIPEFFEDAAKKHPWLTSVGSGSDETLCPVLADPSCTMSATYGVVGDDGLGLSNRATTLIIDRDGIIRFDSRGKRFEAHEGKLNFDRPPVDLLLKTIDGLKKK